MPKDKEKGSKHLLDTMVDAAKTNVEFAKQGVASAAANLSNAITAKTTKPKRLEPIQPLLGKRERKSV